MDGVLIVAHGSRAEKTQITMNDIVSMVKTKLPQITIEIGYMEFCDQTIESGLQKLVDKGVTHIKVVPYFLFHGIHIKEDIPAEINKFLQAHPSITASFGDTLGADERLADILVDRIG